MVIAYFWVGQLPDDIDHQEPLDTESDDEHYGDESTRQLSLNCGADVRNEEAPELTGSDE